MSIGMALSLKGNPNYWNIGGWIYKNMIKDYMSCFWTLVNSLSWCDVLIVFSQLFVLFSVEVLMLIVFSCYLFLVKIKPKLTNLLRPNCSVTRKTTARWMWRAEKRFALTYYFQRARLVLRWVQVEHVEKPFPFTWWEEVLSLYEMWGEGKVCGNGNNTTKWMWASVQCNMLSER